MDPTALASVAGGNLLSLIERFSEANDRTTRKQNVVRLISVPPSATFDRSAFSQVIWEKKPAILLPPPFDAENDKAGPPWAAEVPSEAVQACLKLEFLGAIGYRTEVEDSWSFIFAATMAASKKPIREYLSLAQEAGKASVLLAPDQAPVHLTSRPRNLWTTWLFGFLGKTSWVRSGDGYRAIDLAFGASAALCRILLYGNMNPAKPEAETGAARSGSTTDSKSKPAKARLRPTEARDRWIYLQAMRGISYQEIANRLRIIAEKKGWKPVNTRNGVRLIARKYAARHKLPMPPPRQEKEP